MAIAVALCALDVLAAGFRHPGYPTHHTQTAQVGKDAFILRIRHSAVFKPHLELRMTSRYQPSLIMTAAI